MRTLLTLLVATTVLVCWDSGRTYARDEAGQQAPALPLYRLTRIRLPAHAGGPHAGVSRSVGLADFGSRDGVNRGSVFNVRRQQQLIGRVRVDQVWRDSAAVSVLQLHHKLASELPYPLQPGSPLDPHYVVLGTIHFDVDAYSIDEDMHERLRHAARFIRVYPNSPLILEGHADDTGTAASNWTLGQQRAARVREFLYEVHRLPARQMHIVSHGDTDPVASNATERGRQQNRRVDIIMMDRVPE